MLASVRRSNWTCGFPASSFRRERVRDAGSVKESGRSGATLSTREWTFLSPVGLSQSASLLGRVYGFFAHGTDPHDRPYSSGILSRANHLCRPPSPAHSAANRLVAKLSPRFRYYSAVRLLARRRSPFRLPAYRVTYPGATQNRTSSPGVTS